MQFAKSISNQCCGANGVLQQVKTIRNIFIKQFELTYISLCVTLIITSWLLFGYGMQFIGTDMVQNGHFSFVRLKGQMLTLILFQFIFLSSMAILGFCITKKRGCHVGIIGVFAVSLLFFGCIPLLVEGNAILEISRIKNSEIDSLCSMDDRTLAQQSQFRQNFIQQAKRFDYLSEMILNRYMCSTTCPCLQYNYNMMEDNPKLDYDIIPEEVLHSYGRSNFKKTWSKGYEPMVWTNNSWEGYKSFMQCYQSYQKKQDVYPFTKVEDVFKLDQVGEYIHFGKDIISENPSGSYFLDHMKELEVFQILEDDFNCSGMCERGLFYFNNPLHYGPPKETCLHHFKTALADDAQPFAATSLAAGLFSLFLFMLHFGLYYRPNNDNKTTLNIPQQLTMGTQGTHRTTQETSNQVNGQQIVFNRLGTQSIINSRANSPRSSQATSIELSQVKLDGSQWNRNLESPDQETQTHVSQPEVQISSIENDAWMYGTAQFGNK